MNQSTQKDRVSKILQGVSVFAVASTFFGFLIVNIYLSIFGFWDFNFLKVQYFSAGALFLLLIILPAIFFFVFFKAKNILARYKAKDKKPIKTFLIFVVNTLIFILTSGLSFLVFIFPVAFSNARYSQEFLNFLSISWIALIFTTVLVLMKSHKEITEVQHKQVNFGNIATYFGAYYRLLFVIFAALALTSVFSFFVYPVVPRYFGGGKPVAVSIGFEKDFDPEQINGTNPFNAFLIYQSSDSFLILSDNGSYLLKQVDVAYIKYLETSAHLNSIENITDKKS